MAFIASSKAEESRFILIVSSSGRFLAQAAKNAGFLPLVIDLFADCDLSKYAFANIQIRSFAIDILAPAVDFFISNYGVSEAVYGSGLEQFPGSLYFLSGKLHIYGNLPVVFEKLHDKKFFFAELKGLNITFPEVSYVKPDNPAGWLIKPMQGQGGFGIKTDWHAIYDFSGNYWQKIIPGNPGSVLFLADGLEFEILGYNTQWCACVKEKEEPYVFKGIINYSALSNEQRMIITGWIERLVAVFNLKGLNTIDFISRGESSYLLEINPRPSASAQLYDQNLLTAHIEASDGKLALDLIAQNGFTGYQIIYSDQDIIVPVDLEWPKACLDLPMPGAKIRSGQPICSIISHQNLVEEVLNQLAHTENHVINKLARCRFHAI